MQQLNLSVWRRPGRSPACHPGRRHKGLGLCKSCYAKRAYRKRESVRAKQRATDWYYAIGRPKKYGIDSQGIHALLTLQQGVCAICESTQNLEKPLHVDHDHLAGTVRGMLCNACNTGLGLFRDNPALLQAAIDYLEAHRYMKCQGIQ